MNDLPPPAPEPVTPSRRSLSLPACWLLGAAVTIILPSAVVFLWAWAGGKSFDPAMVSHARPAPWSRDAAVEALVYTYLCALFLGLPLAVLWSLVCAAAALVQRAQTSQ